jgi:hypothetical protein
VAGFDGVLFANWLWTCGVDCPVVGQCFDILPGVPVVGTLPDVFGSLPCRDRIDRVYAASDQPNCRRSIAGSVRLAGTSEMSPERA